LKNGNISREKFDEVLDILDKAGVKAPVKKPEKKPDRFENILNETE